MCNLGIIIDLFLARTSSRLRFANPTFQVLVSEAVFGFEKYIDGLRYNIRKRLLSYRPTTHDFVPSAMPHLAAVTSF